MTTITPSGQAGHLYLLLRALGLAAQLVTLDKAWTNAAQLFASDAPETTDSKPVAPPTKEEQLRAINIVREAYEQTWLDFAEVAEQLEPLFVENADAIRRGQPALMEQLSEVGKAKFQNVLNSNSDLAAAAQAAAAHMRTSANSEIALVRGEVDKMAKGGTSDGDMSQEEELAVGAVAGAAGSLLGPEATVIIEILAHTSVGESIVHGIGSFFHSIFG